MTLTRGRRRYENGSMGDVVTGWVDVADRVNTVELVGFSECLEADGHADFEDFVEVETLEGGTGDNSTEREENLAEDAVTELWGGYGLVADWSPTTSPESPAPPPCHCWRGHLAVPV